MDKISPLDVFFADRISPLEFRFDQLKAPPLFSMIPPVLDQYLFKIAIDPRYSSKIKQKYELMDRALKDYGFEMLARGTNRTAYKSVFNQDIIIKVGYDRAGVCDAPKEFNNQLYLKPFVTKTFEVSPSGAIGLFERGIPVTYKDEFKSVANDIFDVISRYFIGKFILADIGTEYFMNWVIRRNFGPILCDYPFMYPLDGNKLQCINTISTPYGPMLCNGLIDYDAGFNRLRCERCGKQYFAKDLAKENNYGELELVQNKLGGRRKMSAKIYKNGQWVDLLKSKETKVSFNTANAVPQNVEITRVNLEEKPSVKKEEGRGRKQWAENKIRNVLRDIYFKIGINDESRLYISTLSCLMTIQSLYEEVNYGKEIFAYAVEIRNQILEECREIEKKRKAKQEQTKQEQPKQEQVKQEQPKQEQVKPESVQEVVQEPAQEVEVKVTTQNTNTMTAEEEILDKAKKMLEKAEQIKQGDNPFRPSYEEEFEKDKERIQAQHEAEEVVNNVATNSDDVKSLVTQEEDFGVSDEVELEVQYEADIPTDQDIAKSVDLLNKVPEEAKKNTESNGNSKESNSLREKIRQHTSTTYTDPNGNRMSF